MTFSVGVTAKGSLKGFARAKASDRLKVNTDSIKLLYYYLLIRGMFIRYHHS